MPEGTFPHLGWNPAPGSPPEIAALRTKLTTSATSLGTAWRLVDQLLSDSTTWRGEAATAFHEALSDDLPRHLKNAHTSLTKAAGRLGCPAVPPPRLSPRCCRSRPRRSSAAPRLGARPSRPGSRSPARAAPGSSSPTSPRSARCTPTPTRTSCSPSDTRSASPIRTGARGPTLHSARAGCWRSCCDRRRLFTAAAQDGLGGPCDGHGSRGGGGSDSSSSSASPHGRCGRSSRPGGTTWSAPWRCASSSSPPTSR